MLAGGQGRSARDVEVTVDVLGLLLLYVVTVSAAVCIAAAVLGGAAV